MTPSSSSRSEDAQTNQVSPQDSPQDSPWALTVSGVHKTYRGAKGQKIQALENICLNIPKGSCYGLLGPNGAGKSTLINILAGLVLKDAGHVTLWGMDQDKTPKQSRTAIGVVPQEVNMDPFFTPRQILNLIAGFYGVPKAERQIEALLAKLSLTDKADSYMRRLSGGMLRRVLVAKAMVHQPPILILDEPTAGVDILLRRQLWDYVRELNAKGVTILLTTHYLEEAENFCDYIAIIHKGKIIADSPKQELLGLLDSKSMVIACGQPLETLPALEGALEGVTLQQTAPQSLTLTWNPSRVSAGAILKHLTEAGVEIHDITIRETDLEDIFLSLTAG